MNREATLERKAFLEEIFGDILPVRMVMRSLTGAMTNPLVHLMGMESYYMAMYDCPDAVHAAMEMATSVYEQYYDFLEKENLLLPTNGFSPLAQESFAFTDELPSDQVSRTTECWGYLESQETTAVSASGCLFEIAQREVGTIYGDFERGRHYVQLAKEAVYAYWKP